MDFFSGLLGILDDTWAAFIAFLGQYADMTLLIGGGLFVIIAILFIPRGLWGTKFLNQPVVTALAGPFGLFMIMQAMHVDAFSAKLICTLAFAVGFIWLALQRKGQVITIISAAFAVVFLVAFFIIGKDGPSDSVIADLIRSVISSANELRK